MANIYPSQTRSVDPYSSYNSNSVNRLTRMITRGDNCLHDIFSIDVEIDSTSPLTFVVVKEGVAFMSDVYIKINSDFRVDFEDRDFYLDVNPFNEAGYYYVVLDYYYVKSKPAPQASIKILKPSQRAILDTSTRYLLLKVVRVIFNGATFEISPPLLDKDPENIAHKRKYAELYCGIEDELPPFDLSRDVSRLIYVKNEQEFYFGSESGEWEAFSAVRAYVGDVGSCSAGQLAYIDENGTLQPAISTDTTSFAICAILNTNPGRVRLVGRCDNVPIDPSVTVQVGDRLFLSATTPGAVTNIVPTADVVQYVGSCIEVSGSTCSIWFVPNGSTDLRVDNLTARVGALETLTSNLEDRVTVLENKSLRVTIGVGDWIYYAPDSNYYYTILLPTSYFTREINVVQCYTQAVSGSYVVKRQILPQYIDCSTDPNLRVTIWMPTNTIPVEVIIVG